MFELEMNDVGRPEFSAREVDADQNITRGNNSKISLKHGNQGDQNGLST